MQSTPETERLKMKKLISIAAFTLVASAQAYAYDGFIPLPGSSQYENQQRDRNAAREAERAADARLERQLESDRRIESNRELDQQLERSRQKSESIWKN